MRGIAGQAEDCRSIRAKQVIEGRLCDRQGRDIRHRAHERINRNIEPKVFSVASGRREFEQIQKKIRRRRRSEAAQNLETEQVTLGSFTPVPLGQSGQQMTVDKIMQGDRIQRGKIGRNDAHWPLPYRARIA